MDLTLKVTRITQLTPRIKAFGLSPRDGSALPAFTAGAHIDVEVMEPGGKLSTRSYSLINPHDQADTYEIAVLRELDGTGGSAYMHDDVWPDQIIKAGNPKNDFPLAEDATAHLLVAGGIGITPILAMLRTLGGRGAPLEMHYCARSPDLMAFENEVRELAGDRARFYFDGGDPSRGLDLARLLATPAPGRHLYVCGPKGMNEAAIEICKARDWPQSQVHFEFFTAAATQQGDTELQVVLERSGRTLTIPADKSILDVLIAEGLDPMYVCTRGECGCCITEVLEGEPEHRDYILTDAEKAAGKHICVCVSRAKTGRLVLDL